MLGTLIAAGFGSLLLSNPRKRRKAHHRHRNPESADGTAARELELYIVNDGTLYRQSVQPIIANLAKKIRKGKYDKAKAVKLWQYAADFGAQRYTQEFGGSYGKHSGNGSYGAFSAPTRRTVAAALQEYYQDELDAAVMKTNPRRHRARRRNPSGVTTTVHTVGQTQVIINRWRNRNATAFITVTAQGPKGVKSWDAKSQGPSAGGYSKPDQAIERVYHKIAGALSLRQLAAVVRERPQDSSRSLDTLAETAAVALNAR